MKRIKISLMALAFLFTAGLSYAASAPEKAAPNDCSLTIGGPGTLDSVNDCPKPNNVFCCFRLSDNVPIFKIQ